MGQTTHGIPWPAGTDLVRDGDNAIRAAADKTDLLIPFALDLAAGTRQKAAMMVSSLLVNFDANGRIQVNVSATFSTVIYAHCVSTTFPFSVSVPNGSSTTVEFYAQWPNGSNVTGSITVQLFILGILK